MKNHSSLPNGVYSATLTPVTENLEIDHELLSTHCQDLLDKGSQGIALLGTTGEANSFSLSERKAIMESVVKNGIPAAQLMVGTGCCALPESVELSKHALAHGAGGLLILPPFYYKQVDDSGLLSYFEHFIRQVNNDAMRIYLYHFPKMSGLGFSIPLIKQLIKEFPENIVGIKDSSGDINNMKQMVEELPNFQVFPGTEKYLLEMLKFGGAGCISATANATISLAANVFQAWSRGEEADDLQAYLIKVRTSFEGLPFSGALKTYLADLKNDKRWLNVRPPNEKLDLHRLNELKAKLMALDFE